MQQAIATLLGCDRSQRSIARDLGISRETVGCHVRLLRTGREEEAPGYESAKRFVRRTADHFRVKWAHRKSQEWYHPKGPLTIRKNLHLSVTTT